MEQIKRHMFSDSVPAQVLDYIEKYNYSSSSWTADTFSTDLCGN